MKNKPITGLFANSQGDFFDSNTFYRQTGLRPPHDLPGCAGPEGTRCRNWLRRRMPCHAAGKCWRLPAQIPGRGCGEWDPAERH